MSTVKKTTFVLGDVEVKAVHFSADPAGQDGTFYVVLPDGDRSAGAWDDYPDLPGMRFKRATGLCLDDSTAGNHFWLVYVDDCYDPPVAVVRAKHVEDAIDAFVDELPWAHMSEEDYADLVKDYGEERAADMVGWGPSGQIYDSERVMIREVFPVRVDF